MLPLTPVVRDSAAVAVVDSHAARAMFARAGDAKAAVFRRSDMPIYNGQLVTLKCTFTVNGVKTDPDAITLSVKAPSGDVTTLTLADEEITRIQQGEYAGFVTVDEVGRWKFRFVSSGECNAVGVGEFDVHATGFEE